MKKILSLLLVLTCLMFSVCSLGISASAENVNSGACGEGENDTLEWSFDPDTGKLTISGEGFMQDYSTEAGMQAPWYTYRDQIKSVSLSENLDSIGAYAFYNCVELTTVTIPAYVIEIGASAFGGCVKLTQVIFEDTYDWCVMESADSEMIYLSEEDLSDPQTAATYLTDTYSGYIWSYEPDFRGVYGVGFLIPFIIAAVLIILVAVWSILFIIAIIAFPFVMISNRRKRKKAEQRQRELEEERRKAITALKCVGVAALAIGVISLFRRRK